MRRIVRLFLLTGLALAAAGASAAQPSGVVWKLETPELSGAPGAIVVLKAKASVPSGWHTYPPKDQPYTQPTEFKLPADAPLKLLSARIGTDHPVEIHKDELLGSSLEILKGDTVFSVPLRISPTASAGRHDLKLTVTSSLCNERNCLPPKDDVLAFTLAIAGEAIAGASAAETAGVAGTAETAETAENSQSEPFPPDIPVIRAQHEGLLAYLGFAAAAGALALLTPCVFPMIPITVSFFTKRKQATRGRAVRDALLYSIGIVLTFSGLGLFFALVFGAGSIQDVASNPWLNLVFAAIFVALALSLFGAFEIQLPTSLMNKLNAKAGQGEGIGSVLLMGLVFALTSFTCTGPFVGGVLVQAANGNWLWPLVGMLGFSAVFAAPFFVLALFPALMKSLPKSGGWLNSVKVVMGFLEIAAAMKFISNAEYSWHLGVLTREVFLAAWIALALISTLYLLGHFQMTHDTPVEKIGALRVLFASLSLDSAIWLGTGLLGARLGELDSFIPPRDYPASRGNAFAAGISAGGAPEQQETWIEDWDAGLAEAKKTGKPMFVDFTGFTCQNCRLMEEVIFPQPKVRKLMQDYVLVRLYTDDRRDDERIQRNRKNRDILQDRYQVAALPYYAIVTPQGRDMATFPGMTRDAGEFAAFLKKGLELSQAAISGVAVSARP